MNRLTIALVALALLAVNSNALPSTPSTTASESATYFSSQLNQDDDPGNTCQALAFQEYNRVLTHGTDKLEHFALAETYMVLAERGLNC